MQDITLRVVKGTFAELKRRKWLKFRGCPWPFLPPRVPNLGSCRQLNQPIQLHTPRRSFAPRARCPRTIATGSMACWCTLAWAARTAVILASRPFLVQIKYTLFASARLLRHVPSLPTPQPGRICRAVFYVWAGFLPGLLSVCGNLALLMSSWEIISAPEHCMAFTKYLPVGPCSEPWAMSLLSNALA